jgi:hypothetical protein
MNDIQTIWQTQTMEDKDMITLSDLRARANAFHARVQWRNIALCAYSLANLALTAFLISTGQFNSMASPGLLLMAAHLFVIWQLWWRARVRGLPGDLGGRAALDFLRHELTRQRDAMAGAWLWYIAPFMPGLIWLMAVRASRQPAGLSAAASHSIVLFLVLAASFFWIAVWLAFSRAAARLETQIERLNGLTAD